MLAAVREGVRLKREFAPIWKHPALWCGRVEQKVSCSTLVQSLSRGYGATAARLTPDQKSSQRLAPSLLLELLIPNYGNVSFCPFIRIGDVYSNGSSTDRTITVLKWGFDFG